MREAVGYKRCWEVVKGMSQHDIIRHDMPLGYMRFYKMAYIERK